MGKAGSGTPAEKPFRREVSSPPRYQPSYGRNRGRKLRPLKQGLMETFLPSIQIAEGISPAEIEKWREWNEIWLEIGFGGGEHLLAQAGRHPQVLCIGCEAYINGVAKLVRGIHDHRLHNIRIFNGDARVLLEKVPPQIFSRVFILFPDPWPKKRHHKRRLISKNTLGLLKRVLEPSGSVRLATDDEDYAAWMLEHFMSNADWRWEAEKADDWRLPPPGWVHTRYENKALKDNKKISYLDFIRA